MHYNEDYHNKIAKSINYKKFIGYIDQKDIITSAEIIEFCGLNKYLNDNYTDIQMLCDIIMGNASVASDKFQWAWIFHKKENKGNYPDYKIIWHGED